jgi:hypothetical protein
MIPVRAAAGKNSKNVVAVDGIDNRHMDIP